MENNEYLNDTNTTLIDPFDPFDNPTESRPYNDDYTRIVPQISIEGCKIPHMPSADEKRNIRHFYNAAGGCMLLHFLISLLISQSLTFIITFIIMGLNNITFSELINGKGNIISNYINNTSLTPAITLLSYLTTNLVTFFIGIKITKTEFKSLFKTRNLTIPKMLQYILIAFFIQFAVGYAVSILTELMQNSDLTGTSDTLMIFASKKSMLMSMLYVCIVAPVTEELFYRGFIMKSFSKVSQRFGIIMSAFFFGISHGNISQFLLAFSLGIFMGYIDIKHNSVLPSIIVHFCTNTAASSSSIIQYIFGSNSTEFEIIIYALTVLAFAGLILFILFCRKNIFPKATIHQQLRCKNIAFSSAGTLTASIFYIVLIVIVTFG